jgi:flavin-dependent dehydrogenase
MAAPVAVVGAGPAGCAAALALADECHEVHLVECGKSHKDKPCGDALVPSAVELLRANGVTITSHPTAKSFHRIDLWDGEQEVWRVDVGDAVGCVVPRAIVDQALRNVASARVELRYETIARAVAWSGTGWDVTFDSGSVTYAAVVLATGAGNSLSRIVGVEGRPIVGASLSSYGTGFIDAPRFQFLPLGVAGYCWMFPMRSGRVNVGVCALEKRPPRMRSLLQAYAEAVGVRDLGPPRAGAGPMWSGSGSRFHDPRGIASCGDAAGLVDPITGEGIDAALRSGRAAGKAIASFLAQERNPDRLADYSKWVVTTHSDRYAPTSSRRVWAYLNQSCRRG